MKAAWYAYLFSCYVKSRFFNIKRPLLAGLKITHLCNLKCRHCPFWKKEKLSFSFLQAKNSLKALYDLGVRLVIIEGGEPFLWKDNSYDIRDVVAEAKKLFFSVGITTNGTLSLEANSDIIWVSIDGLKKTHDLLRGESFDRIMANIKRSTHPKIYAHTTINRMNQGEIPEMVKFLSPKVKGLTFQFHYPYSGEADDLVLTFEERKIVLDELIKLKKDGFPIANSYACLQALKDNKWRCHSWMIASVEPDGKLTQGCYIKGRGEVSCKKCGFSAHTEISLAYSGVIESIKAGKKILLSSRRPVHA
ncbi:radical SAM protein [Candidatus Aerophobetes bacterium]|uniref:Radical SAM protein n=1 Tax=Aerophobetes bacterium TaxID=2030807 RepID=A0A523YMD7_UNCAE|nr:MAG: radical SAM protein [Candidatus Aerophobetes bacterium]